MTESKPNPNSGKRRWWRYFSILFAVILMIIILSNISFEELLQSIRTLDQGLLLLALGINIVVVLLMAFRWRVLYRVIADPPTYAKLVKVTLVSIFFNTILPSIVGGDTYRTLVLGSGDSSNSHMEESFAVIFVDRIMGLVALMLLGCLGLALNSEVEIPSIVSILTIVLLILFVSVLLLSMFTIVYRLMLTAFSWLPHRHYTFIESILTRIHSNIALYRDQKSLLMYALIISFFQRMCWLFAGYVIGQALHLDLTLLTFIVFLPVIEIIRLIPITIQGIGVREGLFILFFGTVGVINADAVLLATLIYLMSTIIGIMGGIIYLSESLVSMRIQNRA